MIEGAMSRKPKRNRYEIDLGKLKGAKQFFKLM